MKKILCPECKQDLNLPPKAGRRKCNHCGQALPKRKKQGEEK